MSAGHLGEQVGRRRRDDQEVGVARQADVADLLLVVEIEQVGEHALRRQRADRKRRHELGRGARHHGAHGGAALAQPADEVEALVGGNAAADEEQDTLLFHVGRSKVVAAAKLA